MLAVNAAIQLQRPLLIKGEPGTGKTMLAEEVAAALGMPLLQWHIKSTTKAQQGLYEYDAVSRLRDSQLGDERTRDIRNYIVKGVLWQAFTADQPVVLLIDEIDKADIEFPNDLLRELDRMEFYCYETREMIRAKHRPLVFITSNNEKELPDAFLRRCFFHYIKFPDADTMRQIVDVHFPGLKGELLTTALQTFYEVRNLPGLKKKPSTSELIDWLKLLVAEDIPLDALRSQDQKISVPPLVGALLKNEQDISLFEKLVFMNQRNRGYGPGHADLPQCAGPAFALAFQPEPPPTLGDMEHGFCTKTAARRCIGCGVLHAGRTRRLRPDAGAGHGHFCRWLQRLQHCGHCHRRSGRRRGATPGTYLA